MLLILFRGVRFFVWLVWFCFNHFNQITVLSDRGLSNKGKRKVEKQYNDMSLLKLNF